MWFHDFLYARFFRNRSVEFEKLNPGYKFTWNIVQVPAGQIADKFISALTAGSGAPDIGGLQNQVLARLFNGQFAEKGLVDLAPLIHAEQANFVCWEPYTLDGHIYGVESQTAETTYYYRKDLFDKAGVDPTTMETWDDFIAAGTQMKSKGYWMAALDTTYPEPNLLNLFLTNGSGYFDQDGKVNSDNPGGIQALQLMSDLINTHKVIQGTADFWGPGTTAAIKQDKVAGMIMPDWYLDYVLKNTFPEQSGKWAATPGFAFQKGGPRTAYTGGTGMGVFQQSKWRDLAFGLIHYGYMTLEGQVKRWSEIHYAPTMKEAWTDRRIIDDQEPYLGAQKVGNLWATLAPTLPPFYTGRHRTELMTALGNDVMIPVLGGKKDAATALKEAADKIRAMPQS
jgi:ABC-type glycerol-3-phosphate transport system substrate-binding protein